uniref:Mothers against decapentaplegic homolog n=1 Tax=Glossina palpalis gambiensis TaxID=67801 RepID=A0A1B0AWL0_9MUSC
MKFQSEKKELWRYASKNLQGPVGGTKKSPLLHRLQHQRLLQSEQKGNQNHSCNNAYANDSGEARSISTPPPPYSSIPELNVSRTMDYQDDNFQNHSSAINGDAEVSMSATESEMNCSQICGISKGGYDIVNTGDIMLANNYENLNEISTGSNSVYLPPSEQQKKLRRISPIKKSINCDCSPSSQTITSSNSTTTGLFAATAAKILRNCCGGGFGSTNSESTTNSSDNNNSCNKNRVIEMQTDLSHPSKAQPPEQYFNALMKQLKASQITLLLKAVKARHEPPEFLQSNLSSTSRNTVHTFQANCILTQRALILGEEPYLIACRLFLWRDLKRSSQLKRLPACPNECDPVYVCCNPLHWCRILETDLKVEQLSIIYYYPVSETPPPIYQTQNMNQNEANSKQSHKSEANKISSLEQNHSEMHGRFPVPLSTGGEDNTCPLNWCEIAYWEMAQRVGERYPAQGSTLNIYSETPYSAEGKPKTGMCLKDLVEKRNMPSPEHVQYTRQKIGLGITLQREIDGVWLYNRSTVPIFLYSPTLTESWFRVCRVEPGDCIRAFDKYRAQTLIYPAQFPGVQIGPIDTFSMRISFGKGWGYSYKRPDITRCPCWLEVLFTPQR